MDEYMIEKRRALGLGLGLEHGWMLKRSSALL